MWDRSPTLSERGLSEESAVVIAETSEATEAMFDVPRR